jgi:hypothetical protein
MPHRSRRQVLSALCAGGGVLFAGCGTDSNRSTPDFPEDTASNACPPFDTAARVVCYEAVDPGEGPLVLVPESQSVQPDQPTGFTLRNRSEQRFETNFYHWQLRKRVDGDWYEVAPQSWPEPITPLAAGDEHTWTVTIATGRVSSGDPIDRVEGTESHTVTGLGRGHYAFGSDGWFGAGATDGSIALAAGFELNADALQLSPTDAIAETEWDGETLVARSTRNATGEADNPDVFVLERIDGSAADARQVIAEQVVRNTRLRDAIALSQRSDAARVRLEEFSTVVPPFGIDEPRTYDFRGDRYRVTTREGGWS